MSAYESVLEGDEGGSVTVRYSHLCIGDRLELGGKTRPKRLEEPPLGIAMAAEDDALVPLGEG